MNRHLLESTIADAAQKLRNGGLVAFATETVYGLGADAQNPDALARLYAAKGRPPRHPVIVHVASIASALPWTSRLDNRAQMLMERFWPGPLTLILPKASHVLDAVTGGLPGVGLRMPNHPLALELLKTFQAEQSCAGLGAPSANRFGRISPTRADHVLEELAQFLDPQRDGILDGGPCAVGVESTILDFSQPGKPPRLLRPGGIGVTVLQALLDGDLLLPETLNTLSASASSGLAPGTLASHYAPHTPLFVVEGENMPARWDNHKKLGVLSFQPLPVSLTRFVDNKTLYWQTMPASSEAYAQQLYHRLRQLDQAGLDELLLEAPPKTETWRAVWDRIRRAAKN